LTSLPVFLEIAIKVAKSKTMYFLRCPNADCNRAFQVNRFPRKETAMPKSGEILCPHCGESVGYDHNFFFITHALSFGEEAEYDRAHPARLTNRSLA
jgi:hypothetical protein